MKGIVSVSLLCVCGASVAQVIPNGFGNSPANGTFALTSTSGAAGRTYQYQVHESQLTALVGMNLQGLQFRLNESISTDWPSATASFSQWDIWIGQGVDPASRVTTFADNFVGAPTLVRSGALSFSVGSFSATGSPVKPFGTTIAFNDYLYTGGHLTIEMRFSQQTGASAPTFDAATNTTAGYGTMFGASWAASSTATTATNSFTANFLVTNIVASPVPEPATMLIVGAGAAALLRRRRR